MPRIAMYTRDDVLDAAFEVFRSEGAGALSARKIAGRLGASTAPIYSCFQSIDEIRTALMERSLSILCTYTEREYTGDIFLNIGVGMLDFAKDYRIVYRTLFLENNGNRNVFERFFEANRIQMRKEPGLTPFSDKEIEGILRKLTVYTHGLAALVCADMLDDVDTAHFIRLLQETGSDIIGATAYRTGKERLLPAPPPQKGD